MMKLFYQIIQWLAPQMPLFLLQPILCDISDENLCLDPNKLTNKINKTYTGYVTLNGRSGFIKQIQKICKKKNYI